MRGDGILTTRILRPVLVDASTARSPIRANYRGI